MPIDMLITLRYLLFHAPVLLVPFGVILKSDLLLYCGATSFVIKEIVTDVYAIVREIARNGAEWKHGNVQSETRHS